MGRCKIALAAALAFIAATYSYSQPDRRLEVRQVSSDSLAVFLREQTGVRLYFLKDESDEAFYSVQASGQQFLGAALQEYRDKGYAVLQYDGAWWIVPQGRLSFPQLPPGYFEHETAVDSGDAGVSTSVEVTFRNRIYEIGDRGAEPSSTKAVVRGYVRDANSGEPLVGVSVYNDRSSAYAVTDADGFYRITLPLGDNVLGFSGYSLEDLKLNVKVWDDGGLDVSMKEQVTALKGAVATAEGRSAHRTALMGTETVRIGTIKKVPTAFGEADVIKVVLTLPGVKSVGEAASGFNVRGGATDQNLILFNDATIFGPSHMFGVLSAFNADVINDVELYKSSIPAEFGGRISSVLDIRGKEGNSKKLTGTFGIGLLTGNFTLEGPLNKGKTTFIIGGRTTYSDWMLRSLPPESNYAGGTAGFSDLNASVTHKFSSRNSIQFSGYWSKDRFSFSSDTTFRYSNMNASLKWRTHIGDRHSLSLTSGFDSFGSQYDDCGYGPQASRYSASIGQVYAKLAVKSIYGRHTLSYGMQGIGYGLYPGSIAPLGESSLIVPVELDRSEAVEGAVYAGESWSPSERFSVDMGIRYSLYSGGGAFYHNPEYRASFKWTPAPDFTLKAGYNSMSQYLHMISNNTSVSPMDTWHLSSERVRPQDGWQGSAGLYKTLGGGKAEFSVEGYLKRMYHYLDYKSGAVLSMNPFLEDWLIETTGKAYGVEMMLRKTQGKLAGWLAYTYSRTFLRETADRGPDTINGGDWYNAPCDKPHDVKLVANYKFTHRYSFSLNADYSTGRPVTIPMGKYSYANSYVLAYSERNAYRIPDYFRMDAALNIDPSHNLRKTFHTTFTIGVYNLTGRKNAYSVYYTCSDGVNVRGRMLSVFAMPIPYVNLNVRF